MDLTQLQPTIVWRHFDTLCRVPRPSKAEGPIRQAIADWALALGLDHEQDGAGNLILRKPATPGREHAPGVILQAHLDMVCQKNSDSSHDFTRDPIRPVEKDGWLTAPGTTLGADNGIGVALALAALEDSTLVHGPLEVLLTVDEEAGMGGAQGLEPGRLAGSLMLNLDTEDWGEFYLGCAGGIDVNVQRRCQPEAMPEGLEVFRVALTGLRGGHSGVNIHEERGNAIKLLVRVLRDLEGDLPLRLAALTGGTARNALPREAFATVALPNSAQKTLSTRLSQWQEILRRELTGVDEGITLALEPSDPTELLPVPEQAIWLTSLHAAPHGVWRQSLAVPGVVETSNNLGVVEISPAGGSANFMIRSLLDSGSDALAEQIISLFTLSGTEAVKSGYYPGWAPNPDSALLALCQRVFSRDFGSESAVKVVHAGLECGIIGAKYPGLDTVSFGPNIRGAHAPGERVEIASVERVWQLLKSILTEIAG